MWMVLRKLRLIVPIILTSLLTSFFLLVQICLLESSCHDGLSRVVSTHREVLNSMVGKRYSQSTAQLPLGMVHDYDENINGSVTQGVVKSNGSVGQGVVAAAYDTDNVVEDINVIELLTQSHMNVSTAASSLQTHISSQSITELSTHASIPQAKYTEISKLAFYMLQSFQSHHCRLPHCMDYLSNFDKACIDYCMKKQHKRRGKGKKHVTRDYGMHGDCRFMQGGKRAAVALASLPGSGNTWVRGLLEKATGICTGSVYCDVNLKGAGFNGEAMRSGTVLVVKTHKAEVTWTDVNKPGYSKKGEPRYGAVILLLRNPYNALVAEWNREEARRLAKLPRSNHTGPAAQDNTTTYISHTGSVGPEQFGTNPAWNAFIHQKMSKWTSYIVNMIVELPSNRTRMVVHFEDFQEDRVRAVSQILDFIYFPYTYKTLTEHLKDDFVVFRRSHHAAFEAFTETQEQYMEKELRKILDKLARVNNGETHGIEDYLRKPRIT